MGNVIDDIHLSKARKFKKLYALLKENEILLRIGAYQKGNDPELDEAVTKKEELENFLKQSPKELFTFEEIKNMLFNII